MLVCNTRRHPSVTSSLNCSKDKTSSPFDMTEKKSPTSSGQARIWVSSPSPQTYSTKRSRETRSSPSVSSFSKHNAMCSSTWARSASNRAISTRTSESRASQNLRTTSTISLYLALSSSSATAPCNSPARVSRHASSTIPAGAALNGSSCWRRTCAHAVAGNGAPRSVAVRRAARAAVGELAAAAAEHAAVKVASSSFKAARATTTVRIGRSPDKA
mmetsp:Transcript_101178/g.291363  ORF Transcript_101178/g.291363 Transcript_101178/m.291363 type:complete len:216 (-) Transcript_101178:634-1281(-)